MADSEYKGKGNKRSTPRGKGIGKGSRIRIRKNRPKPGRRATRSETVGTYFPVGRFHINFRSLIKKSKRVSPTAAIYSAAAIEYVTLEILELAGLAAKKSMVKRITPRHLQIAIRADDELDELFASTISLGGIMSYVHNHHLSKYTDVMSSTSESEDDD